MSEKTLINVCFGKDVPAYAQEVMEIDSALLTDEEALRALVSKRALEIEALDETGHTPEWGDSSGIRIVAVDTVIDGKAQTLLEDEGIAGQPRFWDAGQLLSTFAEDGNPETLISAFTFLGKSEDEARACLERLSVKPQVVITLNGGLVDGIMASHALDALVVDYDVDIFTEEDGVKMVPQLPGQPDQPALIHGEHVSVSPKAVLDRYFGVLEGEA